MSLSESRHYRFEELGEGIHAAIARPEGFAICNSGITDVGGATVVFDTGLAPRSARELWAIAERTQGRPPSLAVNSHRHLDHSLGNSEFSTVPVWSTRRTREVMLESRERITTSLRRDEIETELHQLEQRLEAARSEGVRTDLRWMLQIDRALLASLDELRIVPPDRSFETRLALPGDRSAELRSWGSGHTEADAVLHLPKERIVFAGDLVVVGVQPSMGNGDPVHWLTVLDQLERLGAERIVPGHGPVTGRAGIEGTREYLSGVLAAAEAPAGSVLPGALRPWEGSLSLDENLAFARKWLAARRSR